MITTELAMKYKNFGCFRMTTLAPKKTPAFTIIKNGIIHNGARWLGIVLATINKLSKPNANHKAVFTKNIFRVVFMEFMVNLPVMCYYFTCVISYSRVVTGSSFENYP
jgi:hypothetical protein